MNYYVLLLPGIILLLLPILYGIFHGRTVEKSESLDRFFKTSDRCMDALDRKTAESVTRFMDEYEYAYSESEQHLSEFYRKEFHEDMDDLREHLRQIEEEAWLKKAGKHLADFAESYEIIMGGEMETFRDVDRLFAQKKRCVSEWHKYFAIDLTQYKSTIYPKRYLREFMGDQYDPCMESSEALDRQLSGRIQSMRPEFTRKKRLYDLMVAYVREHPGIMRADLMKVNFPGFNADEVKYCYKPLLEKNRLVEYKMGSRYFVSLSDREAAKKTK